MGLLQFADLQPGLWDPSSRGVEQRSCGQWHDRSLRAKGLSQPGFVKLSGCTLCSARERGPVAPQGNE
eukprot:5336806-Heterocapsa_arctica.AAC.1